MTYDHWPTLERELAHVHRGPCGGWHYGDRACGTCVALAPVEVAA